MLYNMYKYQQKYPVHLWSNWTSQSNFKSSLPCPSCPNEQPTTECPCPCSEALRHHGVIRHDLCDLKDHDGFIIRSKALASLLKQKSSNLGETPWGVKNVFPQTFTVTCFESHNIIAWCCCTFCEAWGKSLANLQPISKGVWDKQYKRTANNLHRVAISKGITSRLIPLPSCLGFLKIFVCLGPTLVRIVHSIRPQEGSPLQACQNQRQAVWVNMSIMQTAKKGK